MNSKNEKMLEKLAESFSTRLYGDGQKVVPTEWIAHILKHGMRLLPANTHHTSDGSKYYIDEYFKFDNEHLRYLHSLYIKVTGKRISSGSKAVDSGLFTEMQIIDIKCILRAYYTIKEKVIAKYESNQKNKKI